MLPDGPFSGSWRLVNQSMPPSETSIFSISISKTQELDKDDSSRLLNQ